SRRAAGRGSLCRYASCRPPSCVPLPNLLCPLAGRRLARRGAGAGDLRDLELRVALPVAGAPPVVLAAPQLEYAHLFAAAVRAYLCGNRNAGKDRVPEARTLAVGNEQHPIQVDRLAGR